MTTLPSSSCRPRAPLASTSAAPDALRGMRRRCCPSSPLAARASELAARREAVARCGRRHVVALSSFSSTSTTNKNLAVSIPTTSVLGLGATASPLPPRQPRTVKTAAASSSSNSDLPPAPVRNSYYSSSSFSNHHHHLEPASVSQAAAAGRRLVAVGHRNGGAAFAAAAAGSGIRLRPRGALSALLFLAALGAALLAAAASLVASNTRSCECCKGFGVCRCPVCSGRGLVAFEGKYIHAGDACPRCLGSRAIPCPECGGLVGRRSLFSHVRVPRASAGVASSVDPGAGLRSEERRKSRQSRGRKIRRKFGELFAAFAGREVVSRGGEEKGNSAETEEEEEDDNRRYLGFGAQQTLAD